MTQEADYHVILEFVSDELEKADKEGRDLHIEGMENVHPIHEAIAALLCQNLPQNAIVSRFNQDPRSLNAVLIANALYGAARNKDELMRKVTSGAPLEEIIAQAALEISEGKRIKDGVVLIEHPSREFEDKYLIRAFREGYGNKLYISQSSLDNAKRKAKELKKETRTAYWVATGFLAAGLAVGGYFLNQKVDISLKWKNNQTSTTQPATQQAIQPSTQSSNQYHP